jgi:Domain of unknown function (4846)
VKQYLTSSSLLVFSLLCVWPGLESQTSQQNIYPNIAAIPLPTGYQRTGEKEGSFGLWLRQVPLKSDKTIYLYNGQKKDDQTVQFAVLNISVEHKDLQQCADAVIRLRAEYLYSHANYNDISFQATDGTWMKYVDWMNGWRFMIQHGRLQKRMRAAPTNSRSAFDKYLEMVFSYAGTLSLSKQLNPVASLYEIEPGDVFIKGGSPGHAVIVMDVAKNSMGNKIFLLAQSYMPAQDIHILKNPTSSVLSPWYSVNFGAELVTPQWIFQKNQLARFR